MKVSLYSGKGAGAMLPKVFFTYFASVITILSLVVVTRKNPVHSIVFMLILFFHIAGLYLTLNAEFLAAVQVIVYAGAILVLFLFVVLMLNLKEEILEPRYIKLWLVGAGIVVAIAISIITTLVTIPLGKKGIDTIEAISKETNSVALGKVLYTQYLFPFEVASVILLVAMIGAVVLAKKHLKP